MRIVLLCGGSGKRLWPLSNEIRSKVFLKLLKSEDGSSESMIQRICRQLDEVGLLQSTCIVTHHSQVEITRNHVGEHIPIIGEPYKRGTFTAVALAACYLYEKLQAGLDETICILPVDTFVDSTFFRLLFRFPEVLSHSKADLALIGTKPASPSNQFGYIVPVLSDEKDSYSFIHQFVEKPNQQKARRLIKQDALWNSGIFAFSLRFMMKILNDRALPNQVDAWLSGYEQLAEASFDREVAECTKPAVVMKYEGLWDDLGSWKAITGYLDNKAIGPGRVSDDCSNTHLVNELPYPIEVIGVPGVIVAASSDGILIANKEKANLVKERVPFLSQIPMYGEKRWGTYRIINYSRNDQGIETMIKKLELSEGSSTSYHWHQQWKESVTILSGNAELLINDQRLNLAEGDVIQIPAGVKHGIKAVTQVELIQILIGNGLDQEDIHRIAMNW